MPEPQKGAPSQEQPPYTPASPVKRIIAWVGVAYMVILVLLNVYPFFCGGRYLNGVGPLLICPGCAGLAVICVCQLRRQGQPTYRRVLLTIVTILCALLFLMGLLDGLPALLAGLGVAA